MTKSCRININGFRFYCYTVCELERNSWIHRPCSVLSVIIIIINLLQSTTGYSPLQLYATWFDSRILKSQSCINHHSTWPGLHSVCRNI